MRCTFASRFLAASLIAALGVIALPASAADVYEVDPVHSAFLYRVKHLGASYSYGRFNEASGSFTIDAADPAKNSIEIEVKTASIDTANKARDKHLSGPDFFNATEFPTMTFKSTSFKKKEGETYEVTGDLTILGVTKSVTLDAEFVGVGKGQKGQQLAGWDATLVIDRTDFGMAFMPDAIGAEVTIRIGIEGAKK
ncbi:MAG: YceI family protein [Candidatus Hydrogenedentes bacterium]|nr:YceI family protein [Candidatus Hydrogenedentota bacterium]